MTGSHSAEPIFLEVEQVLDLHASAVALTGENPKVLDQSGFEAAVMAPRNVWLYKHCGLFRLAAEYLVHIARVQTLYAANKRTAYLAALAFLDVNGIVVERSPFVLAHDTLAVANRQLGVEGVVRSLRRAAGYAIDINE